MTANDVDEFKPSWSPDSNYVMYGVGSGEGSEIEILNEAGEIMRVTNNAFADSMPGWGPMD